MKRLSQNEINSAREQVKPTAYESAAAVLRKHTEELRPKPHSSADIHTDWQMDTRPRWQGKLVLPLDSKQ